MNEERRRLAEDYDERERRANKPLWLALLLMFGMAVLVAVWALINNVGGL